MTRVILFGNTPDSIKCPYFDTIILPTSKKVKRFQIEKTDVFFSEILTHTAVLGFIEKELYTQEKCWFMAGIYFTWKLMEYTNDHSTDSPIIPTL